MTELIHNERPKARKDHVCDACHFLREDLPAVMESISHTEKRAIVVARRNGWMIKKGDKYIRQRCKSGGDIWTFKGIPEIVDICVAYDLFPEL